MNVNFCSLFEIFSPLFFSYLRRNANISKEKMLIPFHIVSFGRNSVPAYLFSKRENTTREHEGREEKFMNFLTEISAQYCNLPHIYDFIL